MILPYQNVSTLHANLSPQEQRTDGSFHRVSRWIQAEMRVRV